MLVDAEKGSGDRRRGLRLVADCFYRGPIARAIDAWSRASGGLIRYRDRATHTTRVEEPAEVGTHLLGRHDALLLMSSRMSSSIRSRLSAARLLCSLALVIQ